jgi:predicted permease
MLDASSFGFDLPTRGRTRLLTEDTMQHWLDEGMQDIRYALRTLRGTPGFTIIAVTVFALTVGANTAVFSLLSAVVLRPLPFPDPDRLVLLWEDFSARGGPTRVEPSPADFRDWKKQSASFTDVAAFVTASYNLTESGPPEKLAAIETTANLFEVLDIEPIVGRALRSEDDAADAPPVVVLSDRIWRSRFGADRSIVGHTIVLNGLARTVVGVIPSDFQFPNQNAVAWLPAHFSGEQLDQRSSYYFYVLARLKPDVSLAQARAEMTTVAARLGRDHPTTNAEVNVTVSQLHEHLTHDVRPGLWLLLGAVGIVLLIASANLTNLLLARGVTRRKEIAVRKALGAGRPRLARQLITENAMLAGIGAILGLVIAAATFSYLARLIPASLSTHLVLDLRVLFLTTLVAAVVVILAGTGPMLLVAAVNPAVSLRAGTERGTTPASRHVRRTLVVAEVAMTVVLLVCAGLLFRSYGNVLALDPGFNPRDVLIAETVLPPAKYATHESRQAFYDAVLQRVAALPGVTNVAYVNYPPLVFKGGRALVSAEGDPPPRPDDFGRLMSVDRVASEGYFSTLGIPLLRGRAFERRDAAKAPLVVVINQTMARQRWPGREAIGQRVKLGLSEGESPSFTVIGVVGDVRQVQLEAPTEPEIYFAARQVAIPSSFLWPQHLVMRTVGSPAALTRAVREAVWDVDPQQPVSNVRALDEVFEQEMLQRNTQLTLVGAFALLAFVMAGIGLYGVLSYTVTQQRRDIGIRFALGATRSAVMSRVMADAVALAGIGISGGLLVSMIITRLLASWLFGISPIDTVTFAASGAVLFAMALAASSIPALRSGAVDPASILRTD